jgi:hypothetical protein
VETRTNLNTNTITGKPEIFVAVPERKGYRKSNRLDCKAPTNISELSIMGNTIVGLDNQADTSKLPYWVAFGKAGYRIISEKEDYNQNSLIADLRANGCKLGDSTIKHTLRAGKLLGDSDTRHFPTGITTHEIVKLMGVFGKLKPYQWTPAYKLFKSEGLELKALLAKFGIVSKTKAEEDKDKKPSLNTEAQNKYIEVVCKRFAEEQISLTDIIIRLEKVYQVNIIANRVNSEDTAREKVKADLEKRTSVWFAGKTIETFTDPVSGATIVWDDGSDQSFNLPPDLVELNRQTDIADKVRQAEKDELSKRQAKRQAKNGK